MIVLLICFPAAVGTKREARHSNKMACVKFTGIQDGVLKRPIRTVTAVRATFIVFAIRAQRIPLAFPTTPVGRPTTIYAAWQ